MVTVHIINNNLVSLIANICKFAMRESKTFLFSDLLEHVCIQL